MAAVLEAPSEGLSKGDKGGRNEGIGLSDSRRRRGFWALPCIMVEADVIGESVFLAAHLPQPTLSNLTWFTGSTESRAEIINLRCLDSDRSPKPGMVRAK